ncbi:MAG: hypothetical protein QNJ44_12040 [Rhodobacter sp.]|nr:hypothetical protein [Rhodobacter sp.]
MTGAAAEIRHPDTPRHALRVGALRFRLHRAGGDGAVDLPDPDALSAALEATLRNVLDSNDPGYWVVRRLALPFRVDGQIGPAYLAELFARQFGVVLRRILAGEIVEGVQRFDSRAHWLAACLWAQACGAAAGQWQFARYRHLAALPPGDAVRLTIEQEIAAAPAALALLAETSRIRSFCDRIGDGAARAVLRQLLDRSGQAATLDPGLKRRFEEERRAAPGRGHAAMLAAIARSVHARPDRPLPSSGAARRAIRLATAAIAPPAGFEAASTRPRTIGRPRAGAARNAAVDARPEAGEAKRREVQFQQRPDEGLTIETPYAGIFVLWRSVLELDLPSLLPTGDAAGAARLGLAAALAGPEHARAWADPALHWLCDHRPEKAGPPPSPPAIERRLVAHFTAWRYPEPVVPVLSRSGRVNVLRDGATGDWLALGDRRLCERTARPTGRAPGPAPPGMRDPAVDLDWFGLRHRRSRRGWALLARAAYSDFARRLHGLGGASAAWLWDKLLAGRGTLVLGEPSEMCLPRVQLDLVLRMGALDGTVIDAPGGPVRLSLPGAG